MFINSNIKSQMPRLLGICFIMVSMLFCFASCETPEPVVEVCEICGEDPCVCEQTEPKDTTEYNIKFSGKAEYDFPAEGGTRTVTFTCDGPWKIVIPEEVQEWVSTDPTEGEASSKKQAVNPSSSCSFQEKTAPGKVLWQL